MGKIRNCLVITIIFAIVLIQTCSSSPTSKPDSVTSYSRNDEKKPRYLLLAKNHEHDSEIQNPPPIFEEDGDQKYSGGDTITNRPSKVMAIPFQSGTILNDDGSHVGDLAPDDDMETAENIVFRPLFRYKKQNVERRTVYRDRNGNISSQTEKPKHHHGGQHHGAGKAPPAVLVYDKVTGSYYPVPSTFGSQYPNSYPAYFREARN